MALQFDRDAVLRKYNPATIQLTLHKYALELAILGASNEARSLMSALFQSNQITHVNTAMMQGLCNAWHLTGVPPHGIDWKISRRIDDRHLSVNEIVEMYVHYMRDQYDRLNWNGVDKQDRTLDQRGLNACLENVSNFHKDADSTSSSEARNKSQRLVKALDISLRISQPWTRIDRQEGATQLQIVMTEDLDSRSRDILKQIVKRWDAEGQIYELGLAEKLWPIYLKGAVADAFGVSREQLRTKGQELIDIYTERLSQPTTRTRNLSTSLQAMLELGELNSLYGASNEFWFDYGINWKPDQPFFKSSAREDQISNLEKRLDIALPDDYKDFLRVTDGFGAGGRSMFNGYFHEPELWSADKLAWSTPKYLVDTRVELIDNLDNEYLNCMLPESKSQTGSTTLLDRLPVFNRILEIGSLDVHYTWLVQPDLVKEAVVVYNQLYELVGEEQKKDLLSRIEKLAGSKDEFDRWAVESHWCCIQLTTGSGPGMSAWASFRRYLEEQVDESGSVK